MRAGRDFLQEYLHRFTAAFAFKGQDTGWFVEHGEFSCFGYQYEIGISAARLAASRMLLYSRRCLLQSQSPQRCDFFGARGM